MKNEYVKKIVLVALVVITLIAFMPYANALSIGISPSEKTIDLDENTEGVVYFAISQGSEETEDVEISVDASWLKPEMESFTLSPMEQKFLKFTISPLDVGNYTAKIKASTSITVAMKTTVIATLKVGVSRHIETPEQGDMEKVDASAAISNAQSAISQARAAGVDTTDAESTLTNALEEFDKGNYDSAKRFADLAYSLAISSSEKTSEAKTFLDPIKLAFIVIGIGATVVLVVLVFEITKSRSNKKTLSKDISKKCPRCGEKSFLSYDGTFISNYRCSKCGYSELREKSHSM